METHNVQSELYIDYRFQLFWKQLSGAMEHDQSKKQKSKRTILKLQRCLKWCIAYAFLHNHCEKMIQPYSDHPSLVVKRFWVTYWEGNFNKNIPPTAKDFFEWYCDSRTIQEEMVNF